jgi:hypothetical protein
MRSKRVSPLDDQEQAPSSIPHTIVGNKKGEKNSERPRNFLQVGF